MSTKPSIPNNIPRDKPSAARMYDYFLGGFNNFEIDRIAGEKVKELLPDSPLVAQTNRAFLRRAVLFLIEQGIDQFLDIGSGIPTVGNVHEVAQEAHPGARVAYVDSDPIAVYHSEAILKGAANTTVIQADARQPDQILNHPAVRSLLDFGKPMAVLLIALLHFVTDDEEARRAVHILRDAVRPGSYLVLSHVTHEGLPPEIVQQLETVYTRSTNPVKFRSRTQIETFFDGLELAEPGLVYIPRWHPEGPSDLFLDQLERSIGFAGVGRKP